MLRAIVIHPGDNVAVVVQPVPEGAAVLADGREFKARSFIKVGHKMALEAIPKGGDVIKYGKVIGLAGENLQPGDWVHCHNLIDITEQQCDEAAKAYLEKGENQ